MAQGTTQSERAPSAEDRAAKVIQYERYIDDQVGKTRYNVKLVELVGHAMTLVAGACGLLLAAAVLDQWIVPGGLGFSSRLLLMLALAAAAIWYVVAHIVPLLIKRISPEYAAQTIESSTTSLKNSLLNFLMLRHNPSGVRPGVYEAIEEQAATRLAGVPVESAVDRTHLIHVGYLLLGIVICGCLYKVISPKDPLVSAARVMLPWADIAPPTRVQIVAVRPGTTTVSRGTQVTVSADVRAIANDQPVRLFYTTASEQAVDQQIDMRVPPGQSRFACLLGSRDVGVREDLSYRIEAGDAISRTYHIRVTPAATIVVARIDYDYPAYTGLAKQTFEREGDIHAIEGTRVTIHAKANSPIDTARIDFDCDGRSDRRMKASGDRATATFALSLRPNQTGAAEPATDGSSKAPAESAATTSVRPPRRTTYQILFVNDAGQENLRPVEYQLEVTPDLAPEIDLLAPAEDDTDVPLDGIVEIEARANDPDFALQEVVFHAAVGPRNVLRKTLLDQTQTGQFVGRLRFEPGRYRVKVGDVVEVWAVARDNKTPAPNVRKTAHKRLRITPPEQTRRAGKPGPKGKQANNQANDGRDPSEASDGGQQREKGDDQADGQGGSAEGGQQSENGGQGGEGQSEGGAKGGKSQGDGQSSSGQQQAGESVDGQSGDGAGGGDGQTAGQSSGERGQGHSSRDKGGASNGQSGSKSPDGQRTPADSAGGRSKSTGQQRPGESQGADEAVPSDGSDDGSAFDEMLRRLQPGSPEAHQSSGQKGQGQKGQGQKGQGQKGQGQKGQGQKGQGSESQDGSADGRQQGTPGSGQSPAGGAKASQRRSQGDRSNSGSSAGTGQRPDQPRDQSVEGSNRPQGTAGEDRAAAASGGRTGDGQGDARQPGQPAPQQPASGQGQKRPGGAGQEGGQQGVAQPKPQAQKRPRDKGAVSGGQSPEAGDRSAESSAQGKSQSDSQGEGGSDRAGGGQAGGGQQADRQGTGSSGQNTPADQGAGGAGEKGPGETSSSAGQDAAADRPAGGSGGQKPGPGSRRGAASPAGKSAVGDKTGQPGTPGRGSAGTGGGQGQPTGGGRPASAASAPSSPTPPPPGDQVNLEYAKKATGLVIQRLKDQIDKGKVDQKLLDKLGWNRDDLLRFVRRWDKMYQDAQRPGKQGAAAQQELDDALRSLGLSRDRIFQRAGRRDDSLRQMRESFRSSPPPEYQQQLRAYLKGTARTAVPAVADRLP